MDNCKVTKHIVIKKEWRLLMIVKEIMTKNVVTVTPETPLREAGKIFLEKRISGIPVIDEKGALYGMVTITDMLKVLDDIYKWGEQEKKLSGLKIAEEFAAKKANAKVGDIMSKDVFTLPDESSLKDVMRMMFVKRVHTIPIVNGDKLVGVIGKHDLVSICF